MSNVLDHEKQQQIVALGRLGWSLRRIEHTTGVRRETISAYLKAAGIPIGGHGRRPRVWPPAKPATPPEVSTDLVDGRTADVKIQTSSSWAGARPAFS